MLVSGGVPGAPGRVRGHGPSGVVVRVVGAASGNGLLTVATAMLAALAVGFVETYVVRTALAALVTLAMFPPRVCRFGAHPRLMFRSVLTTTSFVFIILGVQQGSPVVVQTLVATTPLFVLVAELPNAEPPARTGGGRGSAVARPPNQ